MPASLPSTISPPAVGRTKNDTSLPYLPTEIYVLVLSYLPRNDLAICSRASRSLNSIAIPLLYARLEINILHQLSTAEDTTPPTQRAKESQKANAGTYSLPIIGLLDPYTFTTHLIIGLPDPYTFTTHLTIASHTRNLCSDRRLPLLPNLITLRIIGMNFDVCTAHQLSSDDERLESHKTLCPLLTHLHPRRIILPWTHTGISQSPIGLSSPERPFPSRSIQEIVILVSPGAFLDRRGCSDTGTKASYNIFDEARIPNTVKRLTLVLQVEQKGTKGWAGYAIDGHMRMGHSEVLSKEMIARQWMDVLAGACEGRAESMVIVGLETVDLGQEDRSACSEGEVRRLVGGRLGLLGWDEAEAEFRAERIRFVALEDYPGEM